jgi:hypothetical protein
MMAKMARWLLGCLIFAILPWSGCSTPSTAPAQPAPPGAYDPTSGCQQALAHVVRLAVQSSGSGPTNEQRGTFLRRCLATSSAAGSTCVLRLRHLPGRRGGTVNLGPALLCLRR